MKLISMILFAFALLTLGACKKDDDAPSFSAADAENVWKLTAFTASGNEKVSVAGTTQTPSSYTSVGSDFNASTLTLGAATFTNALTSFKNTETTTYVAGIPTQTDNFNDDFDVSANSGTWTLSGADLTFTAGAEVVKFKVSTLNATTMVITNDVVTTQDVGAGAYTYTDSRKFTFTAQ
jgi:Lipocalin-like domain